MPSCTLKAQYVSANSPRRWTPKRTTLCLLKQYEDTLGQPCRDCPRIDWSNFPALHPMLATVLEWGHFLTDDQWATLEGVQARSLRVVVATVLESGRARAMNRNPDALQEKAERRKQRQQANKARGPFGAAPTEPSSPPQSRGRFWCWLWCYSSWFATSCRTRTSSKWKSYHWQRL